MTFDLQFLLLAILLALVVSMPLLRERLVGVMGPVAFYDMVRLSRRTRYFILRFIYAVFLALMLFTIYGVAYFDRSHFHARRLDVYVAEWYFYAHMITQLFAVTILVPAYVAGSIAEEKERKTLEFILATNLTSFEIVFGKLTARFANVVLFALVGLPILSFLQFLGGIDPNLLLAGFAATIVTIVGMGGFSILCSVVMRKPSRAVSLAIWCVGIYHILGLAGFFMQSVGLGGILTYRPDFGIDHPWMQYVPNLDELITVANSGNLVVILNRLLMTAGGTQFYRILFQGLRDYAIFHVVLGVASLGLAIRWLRPLALKHAYDTPQKTETRHIRRAEVSDRPILWKEMHVETKRRLTDWLALGVAVLLLAGAGGVGIVIGFLNGELFSENFTLAINIIVAIISGGLVLVLILGVGIRAATCISGEREKDTLDGLLATPLDSDTILRDKLHGCLLSRRSLFVLLALVWLYGMIFGGVHIIDVVIMIAALVVILRAYTILGMWFSLVSPTSSQATLLTVLPCVVGLFCCNVISPAHFFGYVPVVSYHLRHHFDKEETSFIALMYGGSAAISLVLYGVLGFYLWRFALIRRFRKMAHRTELYNIPSL